MLAGSAIRIWGYATSGSLWLDELFIANNLRELTFAELLQPLRYGQNAPVAWLIMQKLVLTWFGDSEWAFRAPALAASLLTLPLMLVLARRVLGATYAVIPVAVICFSPFVFWQAFQVKQYSFDLLVALAILVLALRVEHGRRRDLVALGSAGLLGIWFSMPAIFVLAGVGLALLWSAVRATERDRRLICSLAAITLAWFAAFVANYLAFLRPESQGAWLYEYWSAGVFPWPLDTVADLGWFPRVLSDAMGEPVGFQRLGPLALVLAIAGCVLSVRSPSAGERGRLHQVGFPVVFTLGAAFFGLYPFSTRLVLFLVPSLAILIATGVRKSVQLLPRSRNWIHVGVGVILVLPASLTVLWVPHGGFPIAVDTRGLFQHLERERQPGDEIVVEHIASHAWRFYAASELPQITEVPAAWSEEQRVRALRKTLAEPRQSRIWVMMSRVTRDRSESLYQAFRTDVANRDPTLRNTYHWCFVRPTEWAALKSLERALPASWQVTREIPTFGGCLWLLQRAD